MGKLTFETTYTVGEYYTPIDILKIAKEKCESEKKGYFFIFLGLRLVLFLIVFTFSILIYPIYLINLLFYLLNVYEPDFDFVFLEIIVSLVLHIFKLFVNIFYLVTYFLYKILNFILFIFVELYQFLPPRTYYFSSSSFC